MKKFLMLFVLLIVFGLVGCNAEVTLLGIGNTTKNVSVTWDNKTEDGDILQEQKLDGVSGSWATDQDAEGRANLGWNGGGASDSGIAEGVQTILNEIQKMKDDKPVVTPDVPAIDEPASDNQDDDVAIDDNQQDDVVTNREAAKYSGRSNPDRPTFRFSKPFGEYPETFTFHGSDGYSHVVKYESDNRYEDGSFLAKNSDKTDSEGGKLVILIPASRTATEGYIAW